MSKSVKAKAKKMYVPVTIGLMSSGSRKITNVAITGIKANRKVKYLYLAENFVLIIFENVLKFAVSVYIIESKLDIFCK